LDAPIFDACLTSRKHAGAVQKDVDEGVRLGVTGTPSFFVNGELISGAQTLETFERLIDKNVKAAK